MKNKNITHEELFEAALENRGSEFFKSKAGINYVTIKTNSGLESVEVQSNKYIKYLMVLFNVKFQKIYNEITIRTVVTNIDAWITHKYNLEVYELFTRIGVDKENNFYYQLNDNKFVKYADDGVEIVKTTPIKMMKNNGFIAQVEPVFQEEETIDEPINLIKKHFNVHEEDAFVFMVWLVYNFIPDSEKDPINHQILVLTGKQGSGKTTALEKIKKIVSPEESVFEDIKNQEDLITTLSNSYITTFDNITKIAKPLQDTLCKGCTGGTYSKRMLFTNNDMLNVNYKSIICINGISSDLADNSDFLDRTILLRLKEVQPNNVDVWNEFNKDLPILLGHIFQLLAEVVGCYKNQKLPENEHFRFGDFVKFGIDLGEVFEIDFLSQYKKLMMQGKYTALQGDCYIETLHQFIDEHKSFTGTASELLNDLYEYADENSIILGNNINPKSLSQKINKYEGTLNALDIKIERITKDGKRIIKIRKNVTKYKEKMKKLSKTKK